MRCGNPIFGSVEPVRPIFVSPFASIQRCIQPVRSTSGMPHEQKRSAAISRRLLSALIAEPRFAATVVWSAARNHSAIIATTTMPQTPACENLLSLSAQHADIRTLHKWPYMKAAAIKKGHIDDRAAGFRTWELPLR
jgi:hypothetical protein